MYCSKMKIKYLKCPAECVNAVNRDERAFVKHGRMQDLLRRAQLLWSGQVVCRGSGAWRNHALAKEVLGHAPPAKIFLNGAFWSIFS